jgi:hypothetical protein
MPAAGSQPAGEQLACTRLGLCCIPMQGCQLTSWSCSAEAATNHRRCLGKVMVRAVQRFTCADIAIQTEHVLQVSFDRCNCSFSSQQLHALQHECPEDTYNMLCSPMHCTAGKPGCCSAQCHTRRDHYLCGSPNQHPPRQAGQHPHKEVQQSTKVPIHCQFGTVSASRRQGALPEAAAGAVIAAARSVWQPLGSTTMQKHSRTS